MMQAPVLTVAITTPQSWAKQHAIIKRRRLQRSPRSTIADLKHLDSKARKAKEELLQKAIEGQLSIKKSPVNGLQLDPFQTFPIPTAGCVPQMAQYCEYNIGEVSFPPFLIVARCSGLGSATWHRLRNRRPFQPIPNIALAARLKVRHLFRGPRCVVSCHLPGYFRPVCAHGQALRLAPRKRHDQAACSPGRLPAML
jgi:hypothetical protein